MKDKRFDLYVTAHYDRDKNVVVSDYTTYIDGFSNRDALRAFVNIISGLIDIALRPMPDVECRDGAEDYILEQLKDVRMGREINDE